MKKSFDGEITSNTFPTNLEDLISYEILNNLEALSCQGAKLSFNHELGHHSVGVLKLVFRAAMSRNAVSRVSSVVLWDPLLC